MSASWEGYMHTHFPYCRCSCSCRCCCRLLPLLIFSFHFPLLTLPFLFDMNLQLLYPSSWQDYELIDSGDFEKLERFGKYVLIRPEPQAIWSKVLPEQQWKEMAHVKFVREQKEKYRFTDDVKGGWSRNPSMPESWNVGYQYNDLNITL